MEQFDESTIVSENGTLYRVGIDDHGWFSIVRVEPDPENPDELVVAPNAEMVSIAPPKMVSLVDRFVDTDEFANHMPPEAEEGPPHPHDQSDAAYDRDRHE